MTEEQQDRILADCLEDYHRAKARGEVPDLAAYRDDLGDLHAEFVEFVAAETVIDAALEPPGDTPLPMAWGPYTLLREIDRGAAGVVYEAMHRKLGRKVALKVLRTGVDTDENARERFRREATALAHVHHDSIVEIYEFGEVDGRPYYAMTLIDGPTLSTLVKRDERPAPRELCAGLAGIADALAALHDAGIIHRDVKPSNIMIDKSGRYILADFGLARSAMATTMTRTGDALGTPLYMSPEQMLGNREAIEERTDVYGLGATLYQLLTGQPPFKTDNLHALMRMILKERPMRPRLVQPALPQDCSTIAMKCLEKDTQDRYASAADLRDDLRRFADAERIAGRQPSRLQLAGRWIRQRPAVAAAALVLLALSAFLVTRPNPALLSVFHAPESVAAQARIDQGPWRDLPWESLEIEPDVAHVVEVRSTVEGFGGARREVTASRGEAIPWPVVLPMDMQHKNVYELMSGSKVQVSNVPPGMERGHSGDMIELAWPRGDLRREDLSEWRIFLTDAFLEEYEDGGYVVFRANDEVLKRIRFPSPDMTEESGTIPAEVLEGLTAGTHATWGFYDMQGKEVTSASFRISAVDIGKALSAIDGRIEGYDDATRASMRPTLRANALLSKGFAQAAWQELQPVLYELFDPMEPVLHPKGKIGLMAAALAQRAVELMYTDPAARKRASRWQDIREIMSLHFSTEEREAFFAANGSTQGKR